MRLPHAVLCAVLAAATLAGCASQQQTKNADDYSGDQKLIAQVIDDLSNESADGNAKDICNTLFDQSVADRLKQGNEDCEDAVDDQLGDISRGSFDIDIDKITVDGENASVLTTSTFDGEEAQRTLTLVKDDMVWRITGIAGGAQS